jgi:hypothetical protein
MRVQITAFLLLAPAAAVIVAEAAQKTDRHVAFVLAAEQAKGHLLVSHELYRDEQATDRLMAGKICCASREPGIARLEDPSPRQSSTRDR